MSNSIRSKIYSSVAKFMILFSFNICLLICTGYMILDKYPRRLFPISKKKRVLVENVEMILKDGVYRSTERAEVNNTSNSPFFIHFPENAEISRELPVDIEHAYCMKETNEIEVENSIAERLQNFEVCSPLYGNDDYLGIPMQYMYCSRLRQDK